MAPSQPIYIDTDTVRVMLDNWITISSGDHTGWTTVSLNTWEKHRLPGEMDLP